MFTFIAFSRHIYMGDILHAHPVRGESHIQRNANGAVATTSSPFYNERHRSHVLFMKARLERLKFAVLFMIADTCWVEKNKNQRMQKCNNRKFIHPSSTPVMSFTPAKFHSAWGEPFTRL